MDINNKLNSKELKNFSSEELEQLLTNLRQSVDKIDLEIVSLLNKRTWHSILIGKIKRLLGLPAFSPSREKEIIDSIIKNIEDSQNEITIKRIYERILDESRAIQSKVIRKEIL